MGLEAPAVSQQAVEIDVQYGLYGRPWAGILDPISTRHPAKFSRNLIYWLLTEGIRREYWKEGDLLLDPMAGVGCGGVAAADLGLDWLGVDVEEGFVEMASRNFSRNAPRWVSEERPLPAILRGDSRRLCQLFPMSFAASAVVTSPPYGNRVHDHGTGPVASRLGDYGDHPDQLGNLRGIVTSPPFAPTEDRHRYPHQEGEVASFMTRAYHDSSLRGGGSGDPEGTSLDTEDTGDRKGQIGGLLRRHDPSDYWEAMQQVWEEVAAILPLGAVVAVVVKDYVRNKKRVEIAAETAAQLSRCGLVVFRRTMAMLMADPSFPGSYNSSGELKRYKGFFRASLERKGIIPAIDWEEVIWCRRQ